MTFWKKQSKINIGAFEQAPMIRGVSSVDRVADFESVGRGFESLTPHQKSRDGFIHPGIFYAVKRDSNPQGHERREKVQRTFEQRVVRAHWLSGRRTADAIADAKSLMPRQKDIPSAKGGGMSLFIQKCMALWM